jgi:hypothetical protein
MNTLASPIYDQLIAGAKAKANLVDQPVCVVVWNIGSNGGCSHQLVVCHKGYAGAEDMAGVQKVLDAHADAEILEIVGPNY